MENTQLVGDLAAQTQYLGKNPVQSRKTSMALFDFNFVKRDLD